MSGTVEYFDPGLNGSGTAKRWFAVFTTPRHEKRVGEHFHVRGIESFLPLYQTHRRWKDGSKGVVQVPLFSNYIFVRIGGGERIPVLEIPGVISIVGGQQSLAVSDSYIDSLRVGIRQGKIEPHPYLTVGMRVRIHSGVMAGAEGILLRTKNNCRVVVTLEMIMKSITVEVEMDDIAPVGRGSCGALSQLPLDLPTDEQRNRIGQYLSSAFQSGARPTSSGSSGRPVSA